MTLSSRHTRSSSSRTLAWVASTSMVMAMLWFYSVACNGSARLARATAALATASLVTVLDEEEVESVVSTSTQVQRSATSLEMTQPTGTGQS